MRITHKAAFTLLENYYRRGHSLEEILNDNYPNHLVQSAILFAHSVADEDFVDVMRTQRSAFDADYDIFTNFYQGVRPLVLKKGRDVTLFEFAVICCNSHIHISEFITVVEATADNNKLDHKEQVKLFERYVEIIHRAHLAH